MSNWTNEDIKAILVQLNNQGYPFPKYEFSKDDNGLICLGQGSSARIYEAEYKGKKHHKCAIKVIGFGNKHVYSQSFKECVKAQEKLGFDGENVVKILDSVELRVWIEGDHRVVKVDRFDDFEKEKPTGNYLHLQFIVMEKIPSIIKKEGFKHRLISEKLERCDVVEVLKLAYDIATALNQAHSNKIIHRDIKLENIFYDAKSRTYKLGDFGISRTTDDGFASTIAFSKGYGAPEVVGTLDDKYDFTADIYSYGMTLYLLLNELKFPDSDSYRPNIYQYSKGYIPPAPLNGSDELAEIVMRMISFDPDDRFQTMEEVLNALDKLKYNRNVKYQREHKNAPLAMGLGVGIVGTILWMLTFAQTIVADFNVLTYIFCGMGILKSAMILAKKNTKLVTFLLYFIGIVALFYSGFSWWMFIVMTAVAGFGGYWIGILAVQVLLAKVVSILMTANAINIADYYNLRWIAVLLFSIELGLLLYTLLIRYRDERVTRVYFAKNAYWLVCFLFYTNLFMLGVGDKYKISGIFGTFKLILGDAFLHWIMSCKPILVGAFGMFFCVFWIVREYMLVWLEKTQERNR